MLIQAKYNKRPVHTWEDLPFCSEGRLGLVKSLCRGRYGVQQQEKHQKYRSQTKGDPLTLSGHCCSSLAARPG